MVPKITLPRAERQVEKTRTVDRAARAVITPVLDGPSGTGRRLLARFQRRLRIAHQLPQHLG
jgi:hypothetical protein